MSIEWTISQKQRLRELNAPLELQNKCFSDVKERDSAFRKIERVLVNESKQHLYNIIESYRYPILCELESRLAGTLIHNHFLQVVTPIIVARKSLEKMCISKNSELLNQIFWIGKNKCLRPMLAPNLYQILKKFIRLYKKPLKVFEIGTCFRKDSGGRYHLNEFTMLNVVELGLPSESGLKRLKEIAELVMDSSGINNYYFATNRCEVYGNTVDIISNDLEVASGVVGPHPLDANWGIIDPWVGIGFGLERLALVKKGYQNIQRVGRSLTYFDGIRLNI